MHAGVSGEAAKAAGKAALVRQRFRDVAPSEYVHPGDVLAWAVTVAWIDVVAYRAELRDKADAKTLDDADLDRLARMQFEVARVSKMALDANVDERQIRLAERTAEQLVAVLRGVVTELGHDANDPGVQSVMHRQLALVAGEPAA